MAPASAGGGPGAQSRRDLLVSAVAHHLPALALPHIPYGGYHLWLRLPDALPEAALVATALRSGVAAAPGRPYFCAEPPPGTSG